jgi:hypothetical protein
MFPAIPGSGFVSLAQELGAGEPNLIPERAGRNARGTFEEIAEKRQVLRPSRFIVATRSFCNMAAEFFHQIQAEPSTSPATKITEIGKTIDLSTAKCGG